MPRTPKILLLSANREFLPYPVFPLGLAYVETALAEAGYETAVFDVNRHEPESAPAALEEATAQFTPELIGVSIRNIDNLTWPTSQSYVEDIRSLVDACRRAAPGVPVLVGGAGYSLFPREALVALDADAGIAGDSEGRIAALAEALIARRPPADIGGVWYRDGDRVRRTGPVDPEDLTFPEGAPRRTGFDAEFYTREGGMGNVQTKRGCPFQCSYCTYPLLEGRCFLMRPAEAVAGEIADLAARGVDYLYFADNYFNFPVEHADAVCRALIARGLDVPWSCFAHPAHFDERIAATMREAGCRSVELGSDAGSAAMLANLKKEMTPQQILDASRACRAAGLPFAHYLLLGGPGETSDTLSETFDLMDRCEPTAVIVMCGIRIYPGTPIQRQAFDEGQIVPDDDLLAPKFYISPAVRDTLLERIEHEAGHRPNWIVPGLEINLSPRLMKWIREHGHKGPAWELLALRGRGRRGS